MKKLKILLFIPLLLVLVACSGNANSSSDYYDMKDYPNMENVESRFIKKPAKEIIQALKDKQEGIYYIGFNQCPWCQSLVPVLAEVLNAEKRDAYYLDVRADDFANDETIVKEYDDFDKSLGDKSSDGSVPFVIVIDGKGNIKTHLGTLPEHDASQRALTKEETTKLTEQLKELLA